MLTARDAYLAADRMRFGGANQAEIWNAFAKRGMGASAATDTTEDDQPTPGFDSPLSNNATVTFATNAPATVYIGHYEARATPIADTDPATALPETVTLAPGTYQFLAVGKGLGHKRFTWTIRPGGGNVIGTVMSANLASAAGGATATGDGSGIRLQRNGNQAEPDEPLPNGTRSHDTTSETREGLG